MQRSAGGQRGFTLIELIIVVAIMGILVTAVVFRMDNLSPRYTLRSALRQVAGQVEFARSQSVRTGKTYGIGYNKAEGTYFIVIPSDLGDEEEPDDSVAFETLEDGRFMLPPEPLPEGVRFERITLATNEAVETDRAIIDFSPMGNDGSHVVSLKIEGEGAAEDMVMSFKFQGVTGVASYHEGQAEFVVREEE